MIARPYVRFCVFVLLFPLMASAQEPIANENPSQTKQPPITSDSAPVPVENKDGDVAVAKTSDDKPPKSSMPERVNDNEVRLTFRDQEWLPALQWLADALQLNLDWQTLPEDHFSLFSTHEYTLEEAEDLINMQLLTRGYTLLKRGEILRVVPLKNIDITLVPHVDAEDLANLTKHQFVRVSFPLEWMIAEQAATEFKPLLSPYGQLFPMVNSNRLEAMDAVINLREMHDLLTKAESEDGRRERVVEFKLEYRKADEIATKVRQLVGLPADGSSSTTSQTQLDIEQARFKAEAVKQMGSNAKELLGENKKPDVFIIVNDKENSILVNAPPNKMEIIRQAIKALDKQLPPTNSTWETMSRVKVYEIDGFDPDTISKVLLSLQERGNLAKETRIQHESAYNRLIAFASPEDQLTIAKIIESFRAEKRSATVLPLSFLEPVYAAKAVQVILKSPERPSSSPGVASDGKFQIEADVEHRRLLLWSTPDELKDVRDFLGKLGESFNNDASTSQMTVIGLNGADAGSVTERFRKAWSGISDVPVIIEGESKAAEPQDQGATQPSPNGQNGSTQPRVSQIDRSEQNAAPGDRSAIRFVASSSAIAESNPIASSLPNAPNIASSLRIIRGENNDLILLSRDPVVTETAKRMVEQFIPKASDLKIIPLQHAQAVTVKRQLETMLATTQPPTTTVLKLSTTPAITIDIDNRTNRLLIQNATAKQLSMIEEFVPTLDLAAPDEKRLVRQQKVYRFANRKASDAVTVIKEVYRDLLSVNDRVYSAYTTNRPAGYNRNLAATATNPEYQGLLSLGVDDEANLLVVSAPLYLVEDVIKLAQSVDTAAEGRTMSVVPFTTDATNTRTREALSKIFAEKKK